MVLNDAAYTGVCQHRPRCCGAEGNEFVPHIGKGTELGINGRKLSLKQCEHMRTWWLSLALKGQDVAISSNVSPMAFALAIKSSRSRSAAV